MPRTALPLDAYIVEINKRLRRHPKFRNGIGVVKDPSVSAIAGYSSYTITWPKRNSDSVQAWFDAQEAVFDIEFELREIYALESTMAWSNQAAAQVEPLRV